MGAKRGRENLSGQQLTMFSVRGNGVVLPVPPRAAPPDPLPSVESGSIQYVPTAFVEWRPIPGLERYEASSDGRIRNRETLYEHSGGDHSIGYRIVGLRVPDQRPGKTLAPCGLYSRTFYVHRLVATAFLMQPVGCTHVDHINGIKDDNRAENLQWVTRSRNIQLTYERGRVAPLRKPKRKLEVLARLAEGVPQHQVARELGISSQYISLIKRRERTGVVRPLV